MNPSNQYHAHIYYDMTERVNADRLRSQLCEHTSYPASDCIEIGKLHDRMVGPHTKPMFTCAFTIEHFTDIVAWLMLNRKGLSILVHPMTGDELADHQVHCLWLGNKVSIDTSNL